MTKRQLQLVRNARIYAVCGVMLCIALGVSLLAGRSNKESLQVDEETNRVLEEFEHQKVVNTLEVIETLASKKISTPTEPQNQLEYPFNTMSHDWSSEDIEGFVFHEIANECKKSGGYFPVEVQMYTFNICKQYNFDYEVVFALIERESHCVWDAIGDDGVSFGYMQIYEIWHVEDMERLECLDLLNPYQNILVGIDYLAQLSERYEAIEDVLAAYNYGSTGAKKYLWNNEIHWYEYNEKIIKRAKELKQEACEFLGMEE